MSKIETQNYTNSKTSLPQTALGIAGGTASGFVFSNVAGFVHKKTLIKNFVDNLDKFTPEENAIALQELNHMVEDSKIADKGFKGIILIDKELKKGYIKQPLFDFENNKETVTFAERISGVKEPTISTTEKKVSIDEALEQFLSGLNDIKKNGSLSNKLITLGLKITSPLHALSDILLGQFQKPNLDVLLNTGCFHFMLNKAFGSHSSTLFHEIGHAINYNKGLSSKIPLKLVLLSNFILIPLVVLNAVFTKKPQQNNEQQEKQSTFKKIRDFTHTHIGLTIAGLSLPLLIEEGMASLRAINFVNKKATLMTESMKKQHTKTLAFAYGTYLAGSLITASLVKIVISVKDKIVGLHSAKKTKS